MRRAWQLAAAWSSPFRGALLTGGASLPPTCGASPQQLTSMGAAWQAPLPAGGCSGACGRLARPEHAQRLTYRTFASGALLAAAPVARGQSSSKSGSRRGWAGSLLLLPSALAVLLGKWQLDRRRWKADLLQRREDMMKGEPVDLFSSGGAAEEYRRVRCTGRYDHARTAYIGPRARTVMGKTEQGYVAVTPLHSTDHAGHAVLVNRGWVPAAWRAEAEAAAKAAAAKAVAGSKAAGPSHADSGGVATVTVNAVVRRAEDPGSFVPANDPASGSWFFLDPEALAAAACLPPGTPLVEAITAEAGTKLVSPGGPPTAMDVLGGRGARPRAEECYPLPKSAGDLLAFSVMPRDHLNYAATWLTLSAATAALAVKALRQAARK